MADSSVAITAGVGTGIDTRTEGTNGNHRQVVVIGDPATNAGVAPVDATAGLKVDLGADNDVTVTGTVDLGATDNAVLDAIAADTGTIAGDTTSIDAKLPALGQALAAASVPVILPAATITTLTPPAAITGFGTAANQTTIIGHVDGIETLLGTIDADTSALAGAVAGSEVQVDVVSSALPTGASTAAKQPALGTAGTASTDVITVQGIASMTALKVDGSGVTQPVSGTVTANLGATDNAVLDDIASDTEAIKTSLAGTLTVTGGGGGTEYTSDAASPTDPVGATNLVVRDDALSTQETTDGDWTAMRANSRGALWVSHDGNVTADLGTTDNAVLDAIAASTAAIETAVEGTLTVTGGGGGVEYTEGDTDATITGSVAMMEVAADGVAPLQGTVAAGLLVNLGSNNDVTVTGTVDLGATDNAVLDNIDADLTTIIGHVDGIEGSVDGIEALLTTIDADTSNLSVVGGGTETGALRVTIANNSTGVVSVDDNGSTLTVDGTVTANLSATDNAVLDTIDAVLDTINAKLVTGTDIGDVTINNSTGAAAVNIQDGGNTITVDGTVAVTQSGTWDEVGINDSGNSITVDQPTGTNLHTVVDSGTITTVSTVTAVTSLTNALPAGTNAIGKLAANSGVDIGDVTLTAGTAAVGSVLPPDTDVTAHTNYARKYYTSTGAVTDGIIWSPAAGKRWHVTTMYINVSAAATVTLEDDKAGGDDPVWKGEIAANSGVVLQFPEHYPMASQEDAADLIVTSSAGNIYITAVGYEI